MEPEMGYLQHAGGRRTLQARQTHRHPTRAHKADFAQYALLSRMAWLTADWRWTRRQEKHMLPRTTPPAGSNARPLGREPPQSTDALVAIGNEPRNPKTRTAGLQPHRRDRPKLEEAD